jgi:hypothetical protein
LDEILDLGYTACSRGDASRGDPEVEQPGSSALEMRRRPGAKPGDRRCRARRPRAGSHPAPGSLGSPSAGITTGCLQWLDEAALRAAKAARLGSPKGMAMSHPAGPGLRPRAPLGSTVPRFEDAATERREAQRLVTRRSALDRRGIDCERDAALRPPRFAEGNKDEGLARADQRTGRAERWLQFQCVQRIARG